MHIRPFSESDKPAILEIAKHTWGGYDYLSKVLDEWIRDANCHLFVLEYRSRVVAFASLKIIDDGRTGWLEGMRVRRWYRKRGFAKAMTQHLVYVATKMGVERLRLTTASDNEATRRLAHGIGMNEILRLKVFWKWELDCIRWSHDAIQTVPCSAQDVIALLEAQPSLVPEAIIIYYWYAFDATKAAIESISRFARFWVGRTSEGDRSLSLGFLRTELDFKQWCTTIYAIDDEAFLSALSVQLQAAKDNGATDLMCLHPVRFRTGDELPWLKRRSHKMALVLFETHRPFTT